MTKFIANVKRVLFVLKSVISFYIEIVASSHSVCYLNCSFKRVLIKLEAVWFWISLNHKWNKTLLETSFFLFNPMAYVKRIHKYLAGLLDIWEDSNSLYVRTIYHLYNKVSYGLPNACCKMENECQAAIK